MDTALDTPPDNAAPIIRVKAPTVVVRPPHRGMRLTLVSFSVCLVALFVAAIAMAAQFTDSDGIHLWAMVMMGAVIIAVLLSAVLIPHLRETRGHR